MLNTLSWGFVDVRRYMRQAAAFWRVGELLSSAQESLSKELFCIISKNKATNPKSPPHYSSRLLRPVKTTTVTGRRGGQGDTDPSSRRAAYD